MFRHLSFAIGFSAAPKAKTLGNADA